MANLGRSETPEALSHHHETRTSARRYPGREVREESTDNQQLIVKLKVGKEKLRALMRDRKSAVRPQALQQIPPYSGHTRSQSAGFSTPGAMGPPSTPGTQHQQLSTRTPGQQSTSAQNSQLPHGHIGRVEAGPPPPPGQTLPPPPPPPTWLTQALASAQTRYPSDSFETMMKHTPIDRSTDAIITNLQPGQGNVRWFYLPRIRCHDCPGKLYTPGPLMTIENFEVHLKNRAHRDRVAARIGGGGNQ